MKKLITILTLFISAISFGQTYQVNQKDSTIFKPSTFPGATVYVQGRLRGDTLVLTLRDTTWHPRSAGTITTPDGVVLYLWNGSAWNLIAGGGSGGGQYLTAGIGLIGTQYNTSAPQTWVLDTAFIRQYLINPIVGVDTTTILVDSIVCVSSAVLEGVSYLVCPTPVGGDTLASHANQIVTRTGGVLNYQTPVNGNQLVTVNPVVYYQYSGTYPSGVWGIQHRVVQATYTNYGGNLNIGTSNLKTVIIGTNNHRIATFGTDSSFALSKYKTP